MAKSLNQSKRYFGFCAQSGDRAAFDELLKTVQLPLFRYIYRLSGEHALAEDVLQEVFIINLPLNSLA